MSDDKVDWNNAGIVYNAAGQIMKKDEFIAHLRLKIQTDPMLTRAETVTLYMMAGIYMPRGIRGIPEKVKFDELVVERLIARWEKLKIRNNYQGKKAT